MDLTYSPNCLPVPLGGWRDPRNASALDFKPMPALSREGSIIMLGPRSSKFVHAPQPVLPHPKQLTRLSQIWGVLGTLVATTLRLCHNCLRPNHSKLFQ